jgi:hypothetical protein
VRYFESLLASGVFGLEGFSEARIAEARIAEKRP